MCRSLMDSYSLSPLLHCVVCVIGVGDGTVGDCSDGIGGGWCCRKYYDYIVPLF